jgi:AcrR family transcriptional regulator
MQLSLRYSGLVSTTTQAPQRPGGRSARIQRQVHRAVIDLLQERSGDELSIALIAERSGVHQATIYRRWGSVPALLNDVVAAGPAQAAPLPDTGSLRGDLDRYAVMVAESLAGPMGVLMLRAAVSKVRPDPNRGPSSTLVERLPQLREMLNRARRRGEEPPTVDELLELVVAPLYFRALFATPATAKDARRLVGRLLSVTSEGGADLSSEARRSGSPHTADLLERERQDNELAGDQDVDDRAARPTN